MPDFLHHDCGFGHAEPCAAIFFRHRDSEPATCSYSVCEFMWKAVGSVFFRPVAVVELVTEGTDGIAEYCSVRGIAQRVELFHVDASLVQMLLTFRIAFSIWALLKVSLIRIYIRCGE